jgi:ParB/RepB/Spo0J family partition protein
MSKGAKGIVKPDFSRTRDQKLDLSAMFAASMATEEVGADGQPGRTMEGARLLPLDLIDHNPYQARQAFDVEALQELADSIREHGVIEPVIVRPVEGRYELVAGERRYRAAIMAEQETIPARIMALDAQQAGIITALENLQREDLDIEDEARQFAYLCEVLEVSQRELARMLGKDHVYISRRIRLLKRPDLMEEYRAGRLVLLQAAALAGPPEEEEAQEAEGAEGVSPRNTLSGSAEGEGDELELVEREDLHGFIVKRGAASSGSSSQGNSARNSAKRPLFRWRPLQQFHNWVDRTRVTDIPPDERATVQAQLTEIKEALEKQLAELRQLQGNEPGDAPGDAPENGAAEVA